MKRILVLDDEIEVVEIIVGLLKDEGYITDYTTRPQEVFAKIEAFRPDLITLDLKYGDGRENMGIDLLKDIRQKYHKQELPVIVISGTGDAVKLTELIGLGLNDYIYKPIDEGLLIEKIEQCFRRPDASAPATAAFQEQLIGRSRLVMDLILKLRRIAEAELDMLILGETGTGKSFLAKMVHQFSPRNGKPFYEIDATTFTPTLFESELFGHEAQSFTGAKADKCGRVEAADGGIVFFDEIGELSLEQQAKLLKLIQHKSIMRVGSTKPIQLDIVVLAATNRDLAEMVQAGTFRRDLFFRLHGITLLVPPLREHSDDIPLLAQYFIKKYLSLNPQVKGLTPELHARFLSLPWTGNVRELENCIKSGLANCRGEYISWEDVRGFFELAANKLQPAEGFLELEYPQFKIHVKQWSDQMERRYILHHLQKNNQNVPKTAQAIGLAHRQQLNEVIRRLKINLD